RWHSASALEKLGVESVPELANVFHGTNEVAKREAAKCLRDIQNEIPGSVPPEIIEEVARFFQEEIVRNSYGIMKPKHLDAQVIS
ncbi:MAG: hypothetical protein NTY83_00095, partial [Candidatus Micrarchaeota archaeon]|nr:hypothetical protein [Candidatus Micrarchaeota archaeon]